MRLVDADRLYEKALDIIHDKKDMKALGIANAIAIAPTVDAEPMRHGTWEHPTHSRIARYCSLCGTRHATGLPNKYCAECGAKMDAE